MPRARLVRIVREGLGETEVEYLDETVVGDHHVRRFQVTMHDAFLMRGLKRLGDLQCEP